MHLLWRAGVRPRGCRALLALGSLALLGCGDDMGPRPALVDDFLLRVVGPPEALYDYRIIIFPDRGEDECEC